MSVVDRSALEASPLADLHAIASELSIDGYRRLRRPELIDAILNRQEGGNGVEATADEPDAAEPAAEEKPARPTRPRRSTKAAEPTEPELEPEPEADADTDANGDADGDEDE